MLFIIECYLYDMLFTIKYYFINEIFMFLLNKPDINNSEHNPDVSVSIFFTWCRSLFTILVLLHVDKFDLRWFVFPLNLQSK